MARSSVHAVVGGRWVARGFQVLAALLVLALLVTLLVAWWSVRRPFPQTSGEIAVPGLGAEVQVLRDEWGIPQVYADTSADLFFAQGFVHAQDRFWEMDFRRHVTAGRLAEMFGADAVETDEFVRTLGWRRVAEQELSLLDPATTAALDAYAEGVNAYLADRSGPELSLEYSVLRLTNPGYEIEPWTPADSVAWLKALAWDLRGNLEEETQRALLADRLGLERTEQLYPPYPFDRNPTIVGSGAVVEGVFEQAAPQPTALPAAATEPLLQVRRLLDSVPELLGPAGTEIGSNSWVVSGSKSVTGRPILANDPHLGPTMPSLWYPMGLHCRSVGPLCPYDVSGFTFSGHPGVVIGHNQSIAWGLTNLGADVSDLVLHSVTDDQVIVDGEPVPLRTRTETIRVAGGDDIELVVRESPDGPLLSDVSDEQSDVGRSAPVDEPAPTRGSGYAVALRWTALTPGTTADAIFGINRAQSWDEFRQAADSFQVPSQNLIYADVDGNIGYQSPGRIPIRGAGDGRYPVPGWDSSYRWVGFIPFEALPSVLNPPEEFIATANNAVLDTRTYPYQLTDDWSYGPRAARIVDLIGGTDQLDVSDMARIQADSVTDIARELVPALLAVDVPDEVIPAQSLLDGWDFTQPTDSAAAAYFNATWRSLLVETFMDELDEDTGPGRGDRWQEVVSNLLDAPDDEYWDDQRTTAVEDRDDILKRSLVAAHADLVDRLGDDQTSWEWGELHTLTATNPTFGDSGIGPIEALFNRGPIATPGGNSTVNAIGWDPTTGYEVEWVPSMRMIVDLADFDRSQWIHLTGSSGHAYHPHYADQLPLWAAGEYLPWRFDRAEIEAARHDSLTLSPTP